jgi:DNA-binding MarR family transcriptional regulator
MAGLKLEIVQERPFSSIEEEALLNLMRTADCVNRAFQLQVRPWGVTSTQYNVLRILRGAHPAGLTCSEIGLRMIATDPDITRLLSRMKALKLIRQNRDRQDRRVVWTRISETGLQLLEQMDPVIQRLPGELLGNLSKGELGELIRLLELGRRFSLEGAERCTQDGVAEGKAAGQRKVSCDGSEGQCPESEIS